MSIKVAINGLGRIGRIVFNIAQKNLGENVEIVAINDTAPIETIVHLLKYDSLYGKFNGTIEAVDGNLVVNGKTIRLVADRDPLNLPWKELGVDILIECTGAFRKREGAMKHIEAGAKKVIITAPGSDEDATIVMGVNEDIYDPASHHIISNASCTTNCLAPFAKVIDEEFGVISGLMTTIHAFTSDQNILDNKHKDLRRARTATESIIPTTTGAAKAVGKVLPNLQGKLNGFALRVPTPTVSVTDIVFEVKKSTTKEEVNAALKAAADGPLKGILGFSDEPLVSIDYRGDERSSIIDGLSTMVQGGNMVKVIAWYDNEYGYSCRVVDLVNYVADRM
ncbi:MAG: type I glyceraldehyde-3-phosphate dehydrogenase [Clostridium sp.]|uniref:type I glyceraldehyde-3-phosphate dehydrogenase n=1 Tax=Clostridium sp. TaxID=1506 RepID=UPI002FC630E6